MSDNNITTDASVTYLIDEVTKKLNIPNPRYDVTFTMKKGDGFMSVIYNAKIKSGDKEVLSVIAKTAPENKRFRIQSSIRSLFENEVLFYNEIYPALWKFQNEKGIEEPLEFAPKCYYTSLEEEKEGLVLDNLTDKGFRVWNRMVPMDENHIELTIKTYAKFHGLSFAFKDQHKEMFDKLTSKIQDIFEKFTDDPLHMEAFQRIVQNAIGVLDPEEDKEYVEKFANFIKSMESQKELFHRKNMDEYSVIGHGDCWCNNMMYKYDDPNNPTKPTGISLLDFQIIRYTTPVTDFTHYFYTSSPKKILDNIEHYQNLYYDTLTDFVKQLGSDPETVYPRAVFDSHWKKYCINGISVAMFMIKIMSSESDEVPDFTQVGENESIMSAIEYEPKDTGYKKRLKDVIVHFCDKGFI